MKRSILSFYDSAMDTHVVEYQQKVLQKFNQSADYHPLFSKTTEKEILHYQGLDHGVSTLFDEGYDRAKDYPLNCLTPSILYIPMHLTQ